MYFDDPNGHLLEIITRPYGSAGTGAEHPHPLVASAIEPAANGSQPAPEPQRRSAKQGGAALARAERPDIP